MAFTTCVIMSACSASVQVSFRVRPALFTSSHQASWYKLSYQTARHHHLLVQRTTHKCDSSHAFNVLPAASPHYSALRRPWCLQTMKRTVCSRTIQAKSSPQLRAIGCTQSCRRRQHQESLFKQQASQQGLLISAGGRDQLANVAIHIRVIRRHFNCTLPIEVVYYGKQELHQAAADVIAGGHQSSMFATAPCGTRGTRCSCSSTRWQCHSPCHQLSSHRSIQDRHNALSGALTILATHPHLFRLCVQS